MLTVFTSIANCIHEICDNPSVKSILAGIVVAILSLFGFHSAGAHQAAVPPTTQAAAAAATQEIGTTTTATSTVATTTTPVGITATTIVNNYISQPVVERVVATTTSGVSEVELDTKLNQLENKLTSLYYSWTGSQGGSSAPASSVSNSIAAGGYWNAIAGSQKIDNLSGVTISNSTIDTASIPDLSKSYLSISSTSSARSTLGLSYASSADINNNINIATWGDSLTAGTGATTDTAYPADLAKLSGYSVYNGGVGGQTSTQIEARMVADTSKQSWPTIIWAGRNNISSPSTVEADIASMVSALQSAGNSNFIILSVINGTNEPSGSTNYDEIKSINDSLSSTYGAHYLDVREYLVQTGLSAEGIATTSQDAIDYANDAPPTSLRASGDTLHLNQYGYNVVAQYVYQHIALLQNSASVVTTNDIADLFGSPSSIGSVTPAPGSFTALTGGASNASFDISAGSWSNKNITISPNTSGATYLNWNGGTGGVQFGNGAGSAVGVIKSNGNMGVGTTTPVSALTVNGDITPSASSDNLGNSSYKWNAVYATNGTIQTSDERLKKNIESLDASSSLSEVLALNPVSFNWKDETAGISTQLGFIAQEVQPILPETVVTGDDASSTLGLRYTEFIPVVVSAVQTMYRDLATLEQTVAGFAQSFTSAVGNFGRLTASNELCVGSTCVTPSQFQAMVAASAQGTSANTGGGSTANVGDASSTPPVIQINGNNPAYVTIGSSYADLGATITGPQADLNLGIKTFLNGKLVSDITLDTTAVATDTIDYVVTDQNGLTSTSTRAVIIQASDAPSIISADDTASSTGSTATSTYPTTQDGTSTATAASSEAQDNQTEQPAVTSTATSTPQ